jgi:P27 family predicted phage terminase small subunit
MAGRPRKPTNLKIIEGTARADRINPDEPQYETEIPSCPAQLSAGAKAIWFRVAPELKEKGLIAKINRETFAAYCSYADRFLKAERMIRTEGEVIGTAFGPKTNPWVGISLKCGAQMRQFSELYGLTPSSAGKVNAKPKEKEKPKARERFFK